MTFTQCNGVYNTIVKRIRSVNIIFFKLRSGIWVLCFRSCILIIGFVLCILIIFEYFAQVWL